MRKAYIYALGNSLTGEVRYVGMTYNVRRRFGAHCRDSKNQNTHKSNWIKKLLASNLKPIIHIIDIVDEDEWKEAEKKWIVFYKSMGVRLTNGTNGGDGISGHKHSAETRAKISIAHKGRIVNEAWRAKISTANKKHIVTETTRIAVSVANRKRIITTAMRTKMSVSAKNMNVETRAKISVARKGKSRCKISKNQLCLFN